MQNQEEGRKEADMKSVARVALSSILEFFEDPNNEKAFEEWKKKQHSA